MTNYSKPYTISFRNDPCHKENVHICFAMILLQQFLFPCFQIIFFSTKDSIRLFAQKSSTVLSLRQIKRWIKLLLKRKLRTAVQSHDHRFCCFHFPIQIGLSKQITSLAIILSFI